MDIEGLLLRTFGYLKSEPIIAIGVIVILALLFYFKTKPMLKLVAILLVVGFIIYIVSLIGEMTTTGVHQKEKIMQQEIE